MERFNAWQAGNVEALWS